MYCCINTNTHTHTYTFTHTYTHTQTYTRMINSSILLINNIRENSETMN